MLVDAVGGAVALGGSRSLGGLDGPGKPFEWTGSPPAGGSCAQPPPAPPPPPAPASGDGAGPYAAEKPTLKDRLTKETFEGVADGADALGLHHAAANMRHYLENTGGAQTVSPDEMLRDVPSFRRAEVRTYKSDVTDRVNAEIAKNYHGQPMHFQITSEWHGAYAQKGESQDWFYAVGGFSYSHTADVTVTPGADGKPQVSISSQVHVFDRYNWDPGKGVTIGPISVPDASPGRLHQVGLAQEYDVKGDGGVRCESYLYEGPASGGTAQPTPPPSGGKPGERLDSGSRRDEPRRDRPERRDVGAGG